jgi:hypothetical protein
LFTLAHGVLGVTKNHALIQLGMGVGCTHQDAVEALIKGERAEGLLAVEISPSKVT